MVLKFSFINQIYQIFIISFLGFWRKVETYEEQPDTHFLHHLILILETDLPGRPIVWSTLQNFNHLIGGKSARVPTVKVCDDPFNCLMSKAQRWQYTHRESMHSGASICVPLRSLWSQARKAYQNFHFPFGPSISCLNFLKCLINDNY